MSTQTVEISLKLIVLKIDIRVGFFVEHSAKCSPGVKWISMEQGAHFFQRLDEYKWETVDLITLFF